MAKQSQAWKALERQAAAALGGERVSRGDDFSKSDVDVKIPDFPLAKVDCKYRKSHAHHSLLAEIEKKYCKKGEFPVLVTKHHNQSGAYVTVGLEQFAELLDIARAYFSRPGMDLDFESTKLNDLLKDFDANGSPV